MNIYEIAHSHDDKGNNIVEVPLQNSKLKVRLYEQDYTELVELGAGLPWQFQQSQVVIWRNPKRLNIARILMDADKGIKISFADGNSRNLRRDNLIRVAGSAKHRARDQLVDPIFMPTVIEERHIVQ